jgi:integrase
MQLEEAATLWFRHLSHRNRSGYPKQVEYLLRAQLLPLLGSRPLTEIKKRDLIAAIDCAALRGPSNARHLFAYTRTLLNWCASRDLIERSPADHLSPTHLLGPQAFRTRVLDDRELARIWAASLEMGRFGTIVRLLILTAQRRSEVIGMRWSELSALDIEGGALWTIEATRYKSAVTQRIPLSGLASRELSGLERTGPLVFPSARATSQRPFSGVGKLKLKLDKLSGVEDWTLHDLRRTARTGMARLGIRDEIAEACLGHGKRGLARVYNQHRYEDEMRDAFEQWAARVALLPSF